MLHVLVQFARTEYEYKPRKAKPSPSPNKSGSNGGEGDNPTQASPTTLGLNIHIRKSPKEKKEIVWIIFFFEPFEQQCCSVVLSILEPLAYPRM